MFAGAARETNSCHENLGCQGDAIRKYYRGQPFALPLNHLQSKGLWE
jgi:hypothetical protein